MNDTEVKAKPKYSLPQRIVRIFLKTLIGILAFFILIIILIQTPPVQNFARKKIQSFLSNKLQTKVEIGHLYVGLPKKIILENVYIEDRQRDTLLSGGKLKVDISFFKLFNNEIEINEINLESVTAKIKRTLPDTVYNFQFILDAFAPANQPTTPADTAVMKMSIDYVTLDKIRMVYQDVVTGSDMDVWLEHFDSHIKTFDPATMTYDIPVSNLKGVRAKIYQKKPLMVAEPLAKDAAQAAAPIPINFNFDELDIEDVDIDYRNDVSAFYTRLKLGDLLVHANDIDMQNRVINLQELHLNETQALITMGRKEAARVAVKEIKKEVELEAQNDWRIVVGTVRLNNNMIQMDDENMPRLRSGMDFAHLKAEKISFHLNNLLFSKDSIAGEITKGELREKSGFTLKTLQTDFLYASNQAYLRDLLLETPGTVLRRSAVLTYPSIEALSTDISRLRMDIDLDNARIQVKDILTFVPDLRSQPAFSNPNAIWRANGNITGGIADLNFSPLQLQGLQNTRLDITGNISGLPDVNKVRGNLVIRNLMTSRNDIMFLAPKGTIPSTITIPQNINMQGTIKGGMAAVNTDLRINTSLGSAAITGALQNLTSPANLQYNVQVSTRSLDIGTIIQNDSLGTFTADFKAVGRGTDPATANATFNGTIHSAVFNSYNYKNVELDGKLENQRATASINIADPNIDLQMTGTTFLGSKYPSIHLDAIVDSIKTQPLHLTPQSVVYHGKISADFPVTDPANLQGELLVTESVLVNEGQRVQFDSIQVSAGRTDSGQFIRVRSDAANLAMEGTYNLLQLANVFQDAIQPYFAIVPSYKSTPVDPYNFTLRGTIVNHPTLQTFVPGLEQLEPVTIDGRFSNTDGWHMDMSTPLVVFAGNRIDGLTFNAGTRQNAITFKADMNKFTSGTAMHVYHTTIGGTIANNQINFNFNVQDKNNKNKYQFAGLLQQPVSGDYSISLARDSLLLNYERWTVSEGNSINFGTSGIFARNFALSKGAESLTINSLNPSGTAPVEVRFNNFEIATILGFVQSDTLLANGAINGGLVLNNLMTQPTFTGDLTIQNLSVKNDTVGNLRMIVNNTVRNKYTADVTLTGFGNDLQLSGEYNVLPNNNSYYDLILDVRQLQLSTLEGLSMGAFYDGRGHLGGKIVFNGSLKDPNIDGSLNFFNAGFTPAALGSHFTIEKESILFMNNEGVRFSTFTVKDTLGNTAVLDGMAYTTNFYNYNFDLTLRVRDFQAMDLAKAPKRLYYGQLYFSSNMHITGTEKSPVIDGNLTINEKTKLTVVLPQKQVGVVDREGIVEFVDMDSLTRDSLFLTTFDTLNQSSLVGFDIGLNMEIVKEAELTVIVDQGTGDFLRMRGEGLLTGGIDPSGKITLSGSYEIEDGAYELSFNFLRRRFLLQKGSRITWSGEPTDAELDVTAIYVANTAPIDLVSNYLDQPPSELVIYRQKLPFEVHLMLDGALLKPEITFDVILPEKNYGVSNDIITSVNYRLDEIRTEPSELNKQVFALLLLNRFVGENPFESSDGGGGIDAGTFARQSVSRLLTEQLNQLAANLIQGVDINFDIVTTEDYTQGYMENRTDFNISLSKRLLDERLTVSVGNNFELEGPVHSSQQSGSNFAPNISLEYLLSKDGKYRLRAYRKNEYEGVVEGYVMETGVAFSITLEYNRFKNLFRKPRQNRRDAPPKPEPDTTPAVTMPGAVSKNENEFPW